MTGMEAGWYRDPAPPNPAFPTTLRYWDGSGWTTKVKNASKGERRAWHQELAAVEAQQASQAWEQAVASGRVSPEQLATAVAAAGRQVTPDGQPLSGWWRRVGASVIDSILMSVLVLLLGWPWISQVGHAYADFFRLAAESARAGTQPPDASVLSSAVAGPTMMLALVYLGVQLVYGVGFLKAFQATPGKMVLGLEVRLRERPGPMSWGTVLARWFGQNLPGLLRFVPVVGVLVGGLYTLLDSLWPLWDGKRQALHDKIARTNVVRRTG